ncbi:MAG: ABC transporter ATP-binding protein, partial [Vicinamibacteria bacterium]
LFTRPANVLVLDEPTNDLDLETLELVEAELADFPGTVLLVSHDRTFLDNVVTSTFAFEGDGRVVEYVGGYQDWLRQRPTPAAEPEARAARTTPAVPDATRGVPKKLTYKETRELEALPARIEALEEEQRQLNARMAGADFYKEGADAIKTAMDRAAALETELAAAYERWAALEARSGAG